MAKGFGDASMDAREYLSVLEEESMTTHMKAIGIREDSNDATVNSLTELTLPIPEVSGSDLLVKVSAISLNPVDTKQRKRRIHAERSEPDILGWDAVGTVVKVGSTVSRFSVGDRVYYAGDITRPGSNAEYQLVDERIVGHAPSVSDAAAASIPLTGLTAWEAIFDRLRIQPGGGEGQSILVIGAAGGVGSMAIQLLTKLTKLKVVGTASRPESIKWVKSLGAEFVVDHRNLLAEVRALGLQYVDYILCFNDTDGHWENMSELIAPAGTICTIVENSRPLDMDKLKLKSAGLVWELMFTRSLYKTSDMIRQHEILEGLSEMITQGQIVTTATETLKGLTVENLRKAHTLLESGQTIGKITIQF